VAAPGFSEKKKLGKQKAEIKMPTKPIGPKSKRDARERLFPRGERGVVCSRVDRLMRRGPVNRMLKENRSVTKQILREQAESPQAVDRAES
jgi:hypothetical protein